MNDEVFKCLLLEIVKKVNENTECQINNLYGILVQFIITKVIKKGRKLRQCKVLSVMEYCR